MTGMELGYTHFAPPNTHKPQQNITNLRTLPARFERGGFRTRQLGTLRENSHSICSSEYPAGISDYSSETNKARGHYSEERSLHNLQVQVQAQAIEDLVVSGIPRHFASDWFSKIMNGNKIALPVTSWSQVDTSSEGVTDTKPAAIRHASVIRTSASRAPSFDDNSAADSDEGIDFITSAHSSLKYECAGKSIPFWLQDEPSLAEQLAARSSSLQREFSMCSTTTVDTVNNSEEGLLSPLQEKAFPSASSENVASTISSQLLRQSSVDDMNQHQCSQENKSASVKQLLAGTRQKLIPPKLVLNLVDEKEEKIGTSQTLLDWLDVTSASLSNGSTPAISPALSPVTVVERLDYEEETLSPKSAPENQFKYPVMDQNGVTDLRSDAHPSPVASPSPVNESSPVISTSTVTDPSANSDFSSVPDPSHLNPPNERADKMLYISKLDRASVKHITSNIETDEHNICNKTANGSCEDIKELQKNTDASLRSSRLRAGPSSGQAPK